MKRIGIFILAAMISTSYAAIYVNQSTPDSTEYSDTPSANAAEVTVPPVNTVAPQSQPQAASQSNSKSSTTTGTNNSVAATGGSTEETYKVFQIVKPTNGETIQNQPVIPVEMHFEPNMMPGDKVQLYIDGSPVGTPTVTTYQEIGLVDRGTHTLYGAIINKNNQAIKRSNSVTLYVHRNSTVTSPLTPPPPKPPQAN